MYPDDVLELESLSVKYLETGRNYFDDLQMFLQHLKDQENAPNTVIGKLSFVRIWLQWNDVQLSASQMGILKSMMPRKVTVHDEAELTREKLVSLVSHADVMMRAVLLILISSGMRRGECVLFRLDQVHGNEIHFEYKQMKARKPQIYFISNEARMALDEWLKVRDEYLLLACTRTEKCLGNNGSLPSDPRVFPYAPETIGKKFVGIQEKAKLYEYDPNAKRGRLTLHMIRKYTDSTMCLHISKNETNALIGHFEQGDSAYRRYTREQLRDAYKKVEPYLSILAPAEFAELQSETKQELLMQNKVIVSLVEDQLETKKALARLERLILAAEEKLD